MADNLSNYMHNNRNYVRTGNWQIIAQISNDNENWSSVTVPNISANGLLFLSDGSFTVNDTVFFQLVIDPLLVTPSLTYNINLKAVIKSIRGQQDGLYLTAVQFNNISLNDQIQLDELIHMTVAKYGND